MTELNKKVAIVTGSTSGIGEAIARRLSEHGTHVVIHSSTSVEKGNVLANELSHSIYCQGDVSIEADCKKLIEMTMAHYGRLDFLINNAGEIGRLPSHDLQTIANELSQTLNTNVMSNWCLTRYAIPYLKTSADGVIINIISCPESDSAVSSAIPDAVSKAALDYLTKLLAQELAPEIRVNSLSSVKKISEPDDIAELVIALIKSNNVNGEIIVAYSGFSLG